uniref:Mediator of RNA polymerase II transcription subunit 31 n=1 Tax=Tetraselmis sp. GSL018 TaxID=582737 RepID=A0A061S0W9_9CHLO|mmetsp:Transcript_6305/g.15140  ORF Transcript_6305/g.15140 Transcript_6305/m.15140 type:complete len:262 (+) Transcript_6305:89-874(+)
MEGESQGGTRKNFSQLQVSHQEMARIIDTLDEVYDSMKQAGAEWLPVQATGNAVSEELGYEDIDEFEDAIHGSWSDFLDLLPHVEKKPDSNVTGCWKFRIYPLPTVDQWKPTRYTVKVTDSKQLFNSAFLKSQFCSMKIPHIEFEVQADGKRCFNTLYNHISSALFNLGQHAEMMPAGDTQDRIYETCEQLSALLDAPEPYAIVIEDPSGISSIEPMDNVTTEEIAEEELAGMHIPEPKRAPAAIAVEAPGGMDDVDDADH